MKKRILNHGVSATHGLITGLNGLSDPLCISDFDAFVLDPQAVRTDNMNFARRQREISDLVGRKGGVVVCFLRMWTSIGFNSGGRIADTYGVLDNVIPNASNNIRSFVRDGLGSHVDVISAAKGPSAAYYRVLKGALRFTAYLETEPDVIEKIGGTVFAIDSVRHPIGFEFAVGPGRVCFVPVPHETTGDRVGSAIIQLVEAHYGGLSEIEAPVWLADITVPGATVHDTSISQLEQRQQQIEAEINKLVQDRDLLSNYRVLLYGYGKSLLEPVVRSAFRLLGFFVPEPDEYRGEWDVELREPHASVTAIGEVEGSEGVINVDKCRQLLNYVQDEALEARDRNGVLFGNGFRLTAPDASERLSQFSPHALNGAKKNGYCLLPTTELFKAVCAVLESPADEGLKIRIRDSILLTVGVWAFAREAHTSNESADSAGTNVDRGE